MKDSTYSRLRDAFAIIDGIPGAAFDLDDILQKKGESLACGTVACAAGWLGMHPTFLNGTGVTTVVRGNNLGGRIIYMLDGDQVHFSDAMAAACDITVNEAEGLFGAVFDRRIKGHKGIWKKRVLTFLKEKGAI